MNAAEIMDVLRAKAKPNTAKIYRRHGVRDEILGVSYGDLEALVKKIRVNQEIARELWKTGIHDARILATKVADPQSMTRAEIDEWLAAATDYVINDAVSKLAARMPEAPSMALAWIDHDDEWVSAAGWNVLGVLAGNGGVDASQGRALIARIRESIHGAKNRTRYSMNGALIGMGGWIPELEEAAIEAARAIGPVEVDHGETGCKTPDAIEYIQTMRERAAGRGAGAGRKAAAAGKAGASKSEASGKAGASKAVAAKNDAAGAKASKAVAAKASAGKNGTAGGKASKDGVKAAAAATKASKNGAKAAAPGAKAGKNGAGKPASGAKASRSSRSRAQA